MKKLMMLAAIACAAMCSFGAAVDWQLTCGNMKDHSGAAFAGQFALYATGGDLSSDLLVFSESSAGATYNKKAFTVDAGMTADQKYQFYYVITDKDNYSLTSATTGDFTALATGATTINFGNQATYTGTAANWKGGTTPTPEPTSCLLFLIGMAGLALKRKVN